MVLDVNSGSVHVVDDCVYDVLSCMNEGKNTEETAEALSSKYAEQDITEAREEIQELADNGMLFTKDIYENAIDQFSNRPPVRSIMKWKKLKPLPSFSLLIISLARMSYCSKITGRSSSRIA